MHPTIYNTLPPSTGWHLIPFPSPQRVYGRKLHHNKIFSDGYFIVYQIFLPMELRCTRFFTKSIFDSSLKLCVYLMKLALKIPWNWRKIRHFESLTDATGYICPALNARCPQIRDIIRWEKRTPSTRWWGRHKGFTGLFRSRQSNWTDTKQCTNQVFDILIKASTKTSQRRVTKQIKERLSSTRGYVV